MIREIDITQKEKTCLWKVNTADLANTVEVVVRPGCSVLHYSDGSFEGRYNSGRQNIQVAYGVFNSKRHDVTLIAANMGEVFDHAWGVGDIPYRDRRNHLETRVGMHGTFKFSVTSPETLYKAMGGKTEITPDTIADYCRAKLQEFAATTLCEKLQEYDYFTLTGELSDISDTVQEKFQNILFNIGIMLREFSSAPIYFPDEYVKARAEKLREREEEDKAREQEMAERTKKRKEAREEEERKQKEREEEEYKAKMKQAAAAAEAENIAKIVGSMGSVGGAAPAAQSKAEERCSVCGAKRGDGDVYCMKCGHKF